MMQLSGKLQPIKFRYMAGIFVFLNYSWLPQHVFAASQTVQDHLLNGSNKMQTSDTNVQSFQSSGWPSIINTILALAILVAIIYFGLKFLNRKLIGHRSTSGIQILVQQPLTTNRSIHVVEIAGQLYVLGVGDTITCLDKITDEQTKAAFLGKMGQLQKETAFNRNLFASVLKRGRSQKATTSLNETDPDNFQETLERQLESLRSMRESIEQESQLSSERHDQT